MQNSNTQYIPREQRQPVDNPRQQPKQKPQQQKSQIEEQESSRIPKPIQGFAPQKFRYLVVLDFEATCERNRNWRNEIIEFPSVLIDTATGERISEFQQYVRPKKNPRLTQFCRELTGIQQSWVDAGKPIEEVMQLYHEWLVLNNLFSDQPANRIGRSPSRSPDRTLYKPSQQRELFAFVTCGDWDLKKMMVMQAEDDHFLIPGYFSGWINVKFVFADRYFGPNCRPVAMVPMLNELGIPLQGRHHSGIDDCRNIASIVEALLRDGVVFEETSPRWI